MNVTVDRQDRETAKRERLHLFRIAVDGKYAETDRGSSSISGACTKEQALILRGLIRSWDTGNTFKTDLRADSEQCCHFQD
jgi:hypothetical protein